VAIASSQYAAITLKPGTLGNLFLDSETVQIPITCEGVEVTWTCRDYFGDTVSSGRESPGSGMVTISPRVTGAGYYDLEIIESDGGKLLSSIKTSFGIVTPVDVKTMRDSRFGVMTHFAQYNDPAILPILARAGIAHFRDEQYWSSTETQPGLFTYPPRFTAYMSKASEVGLQALIPLTWSNRFYDYDSGNYTAPYTDHGRQGYANYGLCVLNRYPDQVHAVEVWNEYNAGTFIKGPATANKPYYYTLMLKAVYETIKPRHPSVEVLAGATVPVAHGFLKRLFDEGAMRYLDAVSVHPYRTYPDGVDLEIAELRELIKSYNGGIEKPIWVTEFSRLSTGSDQDRVNVAPYVAQIVALMLSQGVERMYYYLMMDDRSFPYVGLVGKPVDARGAFRPHPALIAYANAIRQLYGVKYAGRFRTSPSTYAFRFQRHSDQLSVLWSNYPVTVSLASNSELMVTNMMGGSSIITPVSGEVSIQLSRDVQYIWGPVTSVTEVGSNLLADSVSGYSKVAGENGWFYGYAAVGSAADYDPSQFKQMKWAIWGDNNYRWLVQGGYPFASGSNMHPSRSWVIRRWVSNIAGPVSLSGVLSRGSGGDGVNIRIFVDGNEVYNQHLSPNQSMNYNVPDVAVEVGSKIDFTVHQAGESSFDATGFTSTIIRQGSEPRPSASRY
jgi:hypothetical protein